MTCHVTSSNLEEPFDPCPRQDKLGSHNHITDCDLNGDGVGGLKLKKPKVAVDTNPVTGEGCKATEYN